MASSLKLFSSPNSNIPTSFTILMSYGHDIILQTYIVRKLGCWKLWSSSVIVKGFLLIWSTNTIEMIGNRNKTRNKMRLVLDIVLLFKNFPIGGLLYYFLIFTNSRTLVIHLIFFAFSDTYLFCFLPWLRARNVGSVQTTDQWQSFQESLLDKLYGCLTIFIIWVLAYIWINRMRWSSWQENIKSCNF